MDLRDLAYVDAVARQANFTRAATELHVAQPALSVAIRRLESELGVRLFERTSRRVTLTDAGAAFLARAGRVTREVEALTQEMREYAGGTRGRLRVSAWYHIEPRLVEFLRDFMAANPLIEISVAELPTPEALDALRDDALDVASVVLYPGLNLTGIEHVVARTEPYVLVVPPEHRLAHRGSVEVAETLGLPLIAQRPGTALRRCLERILAGHDGPPRIAIETNELASTMAFVSVGLGCAFLTPTIAGQIDLPVARVPVADTYPFVLAGAWRRGPHRAIAQRAIDLVAARLQGGSNAS